MTNNSLINLGDLNIERMYFGSSDIRNGFQGAVRVFSVPDFPTDLFTPDQLVIRIDSRLTPATTSSSQFQFPVFPTTAYNYDFSATVLPVGAPISSATVFSGLTRTNNTITLPNGPGEYWIGVSGIYEYWYQNNDGDQGKLLQVAQWGTVGYSDVQNRAFWGCVNLTSIPNNSLFGNILVSTFANGLRGTQVSRIDVSVTMEACERLVLTFGLIPGPIVAPGLSLNALIDGTNAFVNSSLRTQDYDGLLIRTAANNPNTNVRFHGGSSTRTAASLDAYNTLVGRGWIIVDGGLI